MINKKVLIKKIIYRSSHRGTKEMDLVLGKFVKRNIDKFNISELQDLVKLMEVDDDIIKKWYFENSNSKTVPLNKVTQMLKIFKF